MTIGTEITSGEIVNSNAAWIAARLEEIGHVVGTHLSVPDDRLAIRQALNQLKSSAAIVICGGLGPTSDDVTRECVASWLGKPLVFAKKVWQELEASHARRGLQIREAHKHQCFFPKGATLLPNPVGTALGFAARRGSCRIFVLPGPPREMEAMWQEQVRPKLKSGRGLPWRHWTILGMPESEVAELVEPLIAPLGLEVGYRASVPYVYLKLRGKKFSAGFEAALNSAFKDKLFWTGKIDLADDIARSWRGKEILIFDDVSKGLLAGRLAKPLLTHECRARIESAWGSFAPSTPVAANAFVGQLLTVANDPHAVDIVWRREQLIQKLRFTLPYKLNVATERGAKSAVEWTLYKWLSWSKT